MVSKGEKKNRIRYFDIAKGISIFCMIIGHLGIPGINSIVFTFHMPIFFIISGFFVSASEEKEVFIEKKVRQLLIPYIAGVCGIIIGDVVYKIIVVKSFNGMFESIINWLKAGVYGSGTVYNPTFIEVWQIGALWFLLASFIAIIEVKILLPYKYGIVVIVSLAYWAYKSASVIWLPFDIQAGFAAAIFVYLGRKIKEYNLFEKEIPIYIKMIGILVWGYIILERPTLSLTQAAFPNGVLDIIGAIAGSYFVIDISKYIDEKLDKLASILSFYGKNTLIILCAHIIELSIIPWNEKWTQLESIGLPYILQVWIIVSFKIVWVTVWIFIVNKNSFLKNIFLGKENKILKNVLKKKTTMNRMEIPTKGIGVIFIILGDVFEKSIFFSMIGVALILLAESWEADLKNKKYKYLLVALEIYIIVACIYFVKGKQIFFVPPVNMLYILISGIVVDVGILKVLRKEKYRLSIGMACLCGGIICGQIMESSIPMSVDRILIISGMILCGRYFKDKKHLNSVNWSIALIVSIFAVKHKILFDLWGREYSYMPICCIVMFAIYIVGAGISEKLCKYYYLDRIISWLEDNYLVMLIIYSAEAFWIRWKEKVFIHLLLDWTIWREVTLELIIVVAITYIIYLVRNQIKIIKK